MARRADGEALLRQRRRDAVGVRSAEGVTFDRAPLLASIAVRTARTLFGEALARHALDPRAGPAMAMPGRELGYPELHRAVDACAAWLFGHGCAASEVVGITIADEYLHTVASLALLALGVPQVCLPTRDPAAMRLGLAQRIGVARVVVADPTHVLEGPETLSLTRDVLDAPVRAAPCDAIDADPDAPAIYFASSGTTGESKISSTIVRITILSPAARPSMRAARACH